MMVFPLTIHRAFMSEVSDLGYEVFSLTWSDITLMVS